jgi:DNA polymerase-3 subunit delta
MALRPQQLPAQLEKGLASVYLLAGAEPLLLQECRDAVIEAGQAQGFTERDLHEVGQGFDWDRMGEDSAAMSLFSSRKIVDIRLPTGKPGTEGAKALVTLAEQADPDVLVIVSCAQWSAAQRRTKWASRLASAGVLVEIWPVKAQELPGWIRQRMQQAGLRPEPDAVNLLAEMVEGNLLAAQQEIDKWVMLGTDRAITAADVERAVADSSRFDAFRLVESVLAGRLADSLRVSTGLKRTGVAIQLVIGAFYREMMVAATLARAVRAGEQEAAAFRRLGVWPARQGPMRAAAGRLSPQQFDRAFSTLNRIELQGKGRASGDPWQTLDRLLWFLCEPGEGPEQCAAQTNP